MNILDNEFDDAVEKRMLTSRICGNCCHVGDKDGKRKNYCHRGKHAVKPSQAGCVVHRFKENLRKRLDPLYDADEQDGE